MTRKMALAAWNKGRRGRGRLVAWSPEDHDRLIHVAAAAQRRLKELQDNTDLSLDYVRQNMAGLGRLDPRIKELLERILGMGWERNLTRDGWLDLLKSLAGLVK